MTMKYSKYPQAERVAKDLRNTSILMCLPMLLVMTGCDSGRMPLLFSFPIDYYVVAALIVIGAIWFLHEDVFAVIVYTPIIMVIGLGIYWFLRSIILLNFSQLNWDFVLFFIVYFLLMGLIGGGLLAIITFIYRK